MSTAKDVAQWMRDEVVKDKVLYQEQVVYEMDEEFTYINDNGNLAISKAVLKEFRKLTEDLVVWERGERCWRPAVARGDRPAPGAGYSS